MAGLVTAALEGDQEALRSLLDLLLPTVQVRVARVLYRWRPRADGRSVRQEVEDLIQESIVTLLADDARVLRAWDPDRGLGLSAWVGLVVERQVRAILRTGKRNPWTEIPTEEADLERVHPPPAPLEQRIQDRHLLLVIAERLQQAVSPLGFHVFRRLFVDQCGDEQLCRELNMSTGALHVWRHRLRRHVRRIAAGLDAEDATDLMEPRW